MPTGSQVAGPPGPVRACGDVHPAPAEPHRPEGNRTPDLGIQSPASLASGDSGATVLWLVASLYRFDHCRVRRRWSDDAQFRDSTRDGETDLIGRRPRHWCVNERPEFPGSGRVLRVGAESGG
jgi:hypothetical protein